MSLKKSALQYANNKGTDKPVQLRSLISAFAVHGLDSVIPVLAKSEM